MKLSKSDIINRDLRQDPPLEVGKSSLALAYEAMQKGDLEEAKRITEYARLEWEVVHDMFTNWAWSFFTYIADNFGEDELEKAYRSILGSYYKDRYDKVMSQDVETQLQLTIEGLRGHLMGPDRQGDIEVIEDEEKYTLVLDSCGSGGVARQRVDRGEVKTPEVFGCTKKEQPWSWGKKDISYYCTHCTMVNEILSIENYGHPMRVTEYNPDSEAPCKWLVYKDPKKVPAEYYERVGKEAPDHAPRLSDKK
ncbi:hypothetical protein [Reichenbachiella sp.]|uniref:hypothetical protein n=1 Tax=Reichenbachiella sp. TaxID=2184521 RepID=UPI003B58B756